jgi:hypothetical protein
MDWRQHPATRACAAMSYQYDIFVSYRQTSASKDWVQKHGGFKSEVQHPGFQ